MKRLAVIAGGLLIFAGCTMPSMKKTNTTTFPRAQKVTPPPIAQPNPNRIRDVENKCIIDNRVLKSCILVLESVGKGVVPCQGTCSTAQAKMMARRSAIVAAYRALAEKMYGIKINGRDTVRNMVLQNSTIRAYVEGLIRGANIVDEDYKDGVYSVVLNLRLDVRKWNAFLRRCKNCSPNYIANYY